MVSVFVPLLPDEPDVRVVARWRTGRASHEEVAALRRFLPELRDRPAAEVFRKVRNAGVWVLATCHAGYARRVREEAEKHGLVAVVEPIPTVTPNAVSDDEVVAELTAGGRSVSDFFLVGGLVCSVNGHGELMARSIDDPGLAVATTSYLRRVGAREFASVEDVNRERRCSPPD